jgi:myo-inositol-1(or 4)-monophosphatase
MKKTLIKVIKIAGKELLEAFGSQIESTQKESISSIVTQVDIKTDALITGMLAERFPSHNILSEEGGFNDKNSKYTWVIDPLDGTSNFASAIPWFGVLITLFEQQEAVLAGAYLPFSDSLYIAEKGKGATKNGSLFVMDENKTLKNSLVAFATDYSDNISELNNSLAVYRRLLQQARNVRATNSLIDFLFTAEGKFGACINLCTRIWDISGLSLIIAEAGGEMRFADGSELKFLLNKEAVNQNYPVIAGCKSIIGEIMKNVIKIKEVV